MPYMLNMTVVMAHTNAEFQPQGETFTFSASAPFGGETPQASDLNNLVNTAAAEVSTALQTGFPIQLVEDSANSAGGGAG